jgi:hypothetical protein
MCTICNAAPSGSRDRFIALGDISQMAWVLEEEKVQLHPEDTISTKLWVNRFKAENIGIFYKDKLKNPPLGLRLHADTLVLCIQTTFQMEAFQHIGGGFIGIDVTHNTTQYQDLQLFTLIARDRWGHSMSYSLVLVIGAYIS